MRSRAGYAGRRGREEGALGPGAARRQGGRRQGGGAEPAPPPGRALQQAGSGRCSQERLRRDPTFSAEAGGSGGGWVPPGRGRECSLPSKDHHSGIPVPRSFQLWPLLPTFNQGLSTLTHPHRLGLHPVGSPSWMGGSEDGKKKKRLARALRHTPQFFSGLLGSEPKYWPCAQVRVVHSVTSGRRCGLWEDLAAAGPHCVVLPPSSCGPTNGEKQGICTALLQTNPPLPGCSTLKHPEGPSPLASSLPSCWGRHTPCCKLSRARGSPQG